MIEETAIAIDIDGENITVESEIKSACSGCQQVDNCGSGQVAKAFPQHKLTLTLTTDLPLSIGDSVIIGLSEKHLLRSAWQVYVWPLMGLIIGAILGQWLVEQEVFPHELLAIILAGFGGYLGFLLAKRQQKYGIYCKSLTPQILRVIKQPISVKQINS
jgi:sigma-E factor negative regulatory protein RseC